MRVDYRLRTVYYPTPNAITTVASYRVAHITLTTVSLITRIASRICFNPASTYATTFTRTVPFQCVVLGAVRFIRYTSGSLLLALLLRSVAFGGLRCALQWPFCSKLTESIGARRALCGVSRISSRCLLSVPVAFWIPHTTNSCCRQGFV